MANWGEIRQEYETTEITLKALAEKHDIKLGTLKSRKSREGWVRGEPKKDATTAKKVATPKKKDATEKRIEEPTFELVVESEELTEKQRLFCTYYVKYRNKTKAYMKAYGCSWKTANSHAYRLWEIEGVRKEIDRQLEEIREEIKLDSKDILQKYIDIAFADITDFVEFGREEVTDDLGNPYEMNRVKFKESTEVDGTIITEVKQGKDGVSVKLADKMRALEKLAVHVDLFPDEFERKIKEERLKMDQQRNSREATAQESEMAAMLRQLTAGESNGTDS